MAGDIGHGLTSDMTASDAASPPRPMQLVLDLDGFEGPIDLLLSLARDQRTRSEPGAHFIQHQRWFLLPLSSMR